MRLYPRGLWTKWPDPFKVLSRRAAKLDCYDTAQSLVEKVRRDEITPKETEAGSAYWATRDHFRLVSGRGTSGNYFARLSVYVRGVHGHVPIFTDTAERAKELYHRLEQKIQPNSTASRAV